MTHAGPDRATSETGAVGGRTSGSGDFYVAYLPVPPRVRRFVHVATAACIGIAGIAALLLAHVQGDPGDGVWDDATARSFVGVLRTTPYPILVPDGETAEREGDDPLTRRGYLVVGFGKHGAGERVEAFEGQRVRLSGWRLERQGRRMIELEPTTDAITPSGTMGDGRAGAEIGGPRPSPKARVTLRGEIVDSKCYLGAMKPGDGRTHKACATLCIRGGIPPSFVSRNQDGTASIYLLVNERGEALSPEAFPFIADAVELTGEVGELHGLPVLRVAATDIRRLE